MTLLLENLAKAEGLNVNEAGRLRELISVYEYHRDKNAKKKRYYEGHIPLSEVNLGLALPKRILGLEIGCAWGEKAVDVLASRSMFDGYVGRNGYASDSIMAIMNANNMKAEYMKACRDELKYGCTFATLSADPKIGCRIRFHSPETAAALWNGEKGRISCGFAIIDTASDEKEKASWAPSLVNYYTDTAVWLLHNRNGRWYAEEHPHTMGRPLMEPLIWNASSDKPFGRSRLKQPVRNLIQQYIRTMANATIALEFSTAPQKYLLGVTEDQYDQITSDKFKQYVGSILVSTSNPETGQNPTVGQFQQGTIEPHIQMIRAIATKFCSATDLSVTDVGVINDANPTSAEAILAQTQALVLKAEQLNAGNGAALDQIALMALAIAQNTTIEELSEEDRDIMAHFKNPAMPSVSVTTDAAIKIATARPEFASTDVFAEMIGFDQADIRRIKAQEAKARGLATLTEEFNDDLTGGMA